MSDCQEDVDEKNMQLVRLKQQHVLQALINEGLICGWINEGCDFSWQQRLSEINQQFSLLFSLKIPPILLAKCIQNQ